MYLNASILEERKTNQQTQLINLFKKKKQFFSKIDCVFIDYFSTAKKDPLQKVSPEKVSMKQFT